MGVEPRILLEKDYSSESIIDAEQDISDALNDNTDGILVDQYGFMAGTIRILMTWTPEEIE